nr:EamA family transporter [Hyphomicrobiales bacterium]
MTPAITLAVLVAAFCHASWNAIIRVRGDKILSITLLITAAGLIALPGLFVVPFLPAAAWPFLLASVVIHTGYNTFLALSYAHGELSRVYPLVRGSAPLLTLGISLAILQEPVNGFGVIGIVLLASGIMALALERGWRALIASPRGLIYAGATSLCITAYTLSDGLGARAAGNAHHYVIWLFVLEALPLLAAVIILRGRDLAASVRANWGAGLIGGALSLISYWIAIWAMTVA